MAGLTELIGWRDALMEARYSGLRRVEYAGRVQEYKSDSEMQAALAALNREISSASRPTISMIRVSSSKGV